MRQTLLSLSCFVQEGGGKYMGVSENKGYLILGSL